jgi:hypothetical protein
VQESKIVWFHVDECLPVIPDGKYGLQVLVVMYDNVYDEITDNGWFVDTASYSHTTDRNGNKKKMFENSDKEFDFMDLYIGNHDSEFGPTGDPVIYWAYIPELPKDLIKPKH